MIWLYVHAMIASMALNSYGVNNNSGVATVFAAICFFTNVGFLCHDIARKGSKV